MRALAIRRYKAPMEMMELARPEPGPGDLLVRVRAASVNPLDYKIRDGGVKVLLPYESSPATPSGRWSFALRTRAAVRIRTTVALSLVLGSGTASSVAYAQGAENAFGAGMKDAAALAVPLLLAPSNIGSEVRFPRGQGADFRFVLGWAMQVPLPFGKNPTLAHRLTLAPEVAVGTADHAIFRFRAGYRFGWRMLVAGLGIGGDKTAAFVTPELGLRFPSFPKDSDFAFGGLLAARCDLEPRDGSVRVSIMLGWVML